MNGKLVDISTRKLLEKFGAGNHKPGSGSASAFQGMLAAQMLRTVIDLTNDPKRAKVYSKFIAEFKRIMHEIDSRIYSKLEALFQQDSEEFDVVINLREERDKEKNLVRKRELSEKALNALVISTETPIEIAESCLDLVEFATFVFDNGFKAARGDSGVALNSALSAVASCLSIIELNLITLPVNERTDRVRQRKAAIKLKYDQLSLNANRALSILEKEANQSKKFYESIMPFQKGNLADSVKGNSEIENIVRDLQNTLWVQRGNIWKNNAPENPLDILKPNIALEKVMNYIYITSDSLGIYEQDGDVFEIAGLINKKDRVVQVSKNFPQETQNFTAAHELGHAILHRQLVMHRDKPIDGSSTFPKTREEAQADKFATYFLMPSKMVEEVFFEIFEIPKFIINENTVLAIRARNIQDLRIRCRNRRGLARLLASTGYYGGKSFNSLAKIFQVSIETMAIRLEELDLVEF
jgi:formiminotetrahydrofolate cyclodeaminase/Zn-dependent peptidase ImmA (M78 family)